MKTDLDSRFCCLSSFILAYKFSRGMRRILFHGQVLRARLCWKFSRHAGKSFLLYISWFSLFSRPGVSSHVSPGSWFLCLSLYVPVNRLFCYLDVSSLIRTVLEELVTFLLNLIKLAFFYLRIIVAVLFLDNF